MQVPWNTLAMWNVPKLTNTGFLAGADFQVWTRLCISLFVAAHCLSLAAHCRLLPFLDCPLSFSALSLLSPDLPLPFVYRDLTFDCRFQNPAGMEEAAPVAIAQVRKNCFCFSGLCCSCCSCCCCCCCCCC